MSSPVWTKTTVPPDILDYPTSTDMVVREGSNVTLKCAATGSPTPTITWRREGGDVFTVTGDKEGNYTLSSNGEIIGSCSVTWIYQWGVYSQWIFRGEFKGLLFFVSKTFSENLFWV
jgi:Immunoglobulin domain